MGATLDHTIVWCRDQNQSSRFMAEILGLPEPTHFGPFLCVEAANGVSLDFRSTEKPIAPQHYAFLVSEAAFDEGFARIRDRGIDHWADPGRSRPSEINHNDGGRGVYFADPDGHMLEMITRRYGSGT